MTLVIFVHEYNDIVQTVSCYKLFKPMRLSNDVAEKHVLSESLVTEWAVRILYGEMLDDNGFLLRWPSQIQAVERRQFATLLI